MKNALFVLFVALVLAGCSTLSEEECQLADWGARGRADGSLGSTVGAFERYTSSCNRFGIAPDFAAWEEGRQVGLKSFCTPQGVYSAGLRGVGSVGECGIAPDLSRIHGASRRVWQVEREIRSAERALDSLLSSYRWDQQNIRNMRRKLRRDDLGKKERQRAENSLRNSLRDLDAFPFRQREQLRRIRWAERDRTEAIIALSRIEDEFGLGGGGYSRNRTFSRFDPLLP